MELSPVSGIRGLAAVKDKPESDVSPAFAVERSDRMKDDAYKKSGEEPERGMEEEVSENEYPEDETSSGLVGFGGGDGVDFLA